MKYIIQKINQNFSWIYITRPYSWASVVSVVLLANVLATGNLIFNMALIRDILTGFTLWVSAIFLLEYLHRSTDERIKSPSPFIFTIIVLILMLYYGNPITLILLFLAVLSGLFYGFKNKCYFISRLSFLFRGFWEITVFLIILFFHYHYNIVPIFHIILILYLLITSRNLVGDIRDVKYDKFTFPKKYGLRVSYLVSAILIVISIFLTGSLIISLPLIFYLCLLILIRNAYILHRIFTLTTPFFLINYVVYFLADNSYLSFFTIVFITNILFITALLNFTYNLTPRNINKDQNYST